MRRSPDAGPRGTAGQIDIHRDHLVHRNQRVIVEHAGGGGAGAHRDHPLRLRHLLVEPPDDGRHLVRNPPGDDHQVRLPRRASKHLRPEARDIEARRAHRHHFDGATGQPEGHRPDGVLPSPVDGLVERGRDNALGRRGGVDEVFVVDAGEQFRRTAGKRNFHNFIFSWRKNFFIAFRRKVRYST